VNGEVNKTRYSSEDEITERDIALFRYPLASNPFIADFVKALHAAILVLSARAPEFQKLKMVG